MKSIYNVSRDFTNFFILFYFREVDDLEQWIAEREVVAGSHELGQDYDHVTLLWERFREFARDTESIGSERVNAVNEIADSLIR